MGVYYQNTLVPQVPCDKSRAPRGAGNEIGSRADDPKAVILVFDAISEAYEVTVWNQCNAVP